MKTGIKNIDSNFNATAEQKFVQNLNNTSFQDEIPDFDTLFSGQWINRKSDVKKAILPGLLLTFFNTKNVQLEPSILEVITRCFN